MEADAVKHEIEWKSKKANKQVQKKPHGEKERKTKINETHKGVSWNTQKSWKATTEWYGMWTTKWELAL